VYLRETRRSNRDGSVVRYLQLAHNERHPETGSPVAKVIHNFGRAEKVDRAALARLVSSISRFLTPEQAAAAAHGAEVEVLDSRRLGGTWTLDRVWERLGIGAAIGKAAQGRRLDGGAVERVVFALVAQRALEPGSKLAGTKWVAERVAVEGLSAFTDDQAYRAMDFLLDALDDIAGEVFASVAHLLNLDLDIVFVDTTSTYFEFDVPDELAQLADKVDDDDVSRPAEQGKRAFGHSKDFRTDLPQVVIAMAVTRDGVPVRCWTFPGNTADTSIIRTVKDDLAGWNLSRMVWVADRGFASAANRAYLTRGGGHYIHAEKLRNTNSEAAAALARPGRYRTVAGNLRVKEVAVAPGGDGDGDDGARAQRFVVCHNPEQADRDAAVRTQLVSHLESLIASSDDWSERRRTELVGSLKTKPGLRRYLRRTSGGLLRVDAAAVKREVLRTDMGDPTELANHLAFLQLDLSDPDFLERVNASMGALTREVANLLVCAIAAGEDRSRRSRATGRGARRDLERCANHVGDLSHRGPRRLARPTPRHGAGPARVPLRKSSVRQQKAVTRHAP
jgi:hypothetical protein